MAAVWARARADALWLDDGTFLSGLDTGKVASHPLVAASARARFTYVIANEGLVAPADDHLGRLVARQKLLAGRLPKADRADEVTVTFDAAKRQHLRVGSTFPIVAQIYPASVQLVAEHPEANLELRVVGIVAVPGGLPPSQPGAPTVYGTPALYRFLAANEGVEAVQGHRDVEVSPDSLLLRFKHGQGVLAATRRVFPQVAGQHHQLQNPALLDGGARRSIHLQAQALSMLAGLLTVAAILVFAQPFVLAGILGVLGVATMTHLLASAVRRRRRDLAILKTLGFSRGQVTAAVLWQSVLLAAVALLIGIPLGVGVGRWLWIFFATQLGVVVQPRIPVPAVLLVIPASILIAGVVAALPARVASLVKPAFVLRTE